MDALRFVGFALIAIMVVIGLDYYQQDKKHDGRLSFTGYMGTVSERFDQVKAERHAEDVESERQERWRAGAKPYFPAAPEGWTRRAIVDGDFTIEARKGQKQAEASEAARPLAIQVAVQDATVRAKKLDRRSWVYEKDDQTIWLHVTLADAANTNTLAGNIAQSIAAMDSSGKDYEAFGVIGGVAYFKAMQSSYYDVSERARGDWAMIKPAQAETGQTVSFETYSGTLGFGQEIRVLVLSDAPDGEVHAFLQKLDYDGLNALLSQPVPVAGNDTTVDAALQEELAAQMAELRSEFVKLRAELAQMRIQNLDGLSLIANTMAARYGLPNDALDLTANKIATPTDLINVGYRKGLSDLFEAQVKEASADAKPNGSGFLAGVMAKFKGAEPSASKPDTGGLMGSFKSFFQKTDTASAAPVGSEKREVRVHKGGLIKACAQFGSGKRCSVDGN